MNFDNISAGNDLPNDFNCIIEIPAQSSPIKYEIEKESGCLVVDRFMATPMFYPCNYGFIPHTLSDDGDPLDVLLVAHYPIQPSALVRCRPVGVLKMTDESGEDFKLLAVPHPKLTPLYNDVQEPNDLPQLLIQQIEHFFENYKDLEDGKWVKIEGWEGLESARKAIIESVEAYEKTK